MDQGAAITIVVADARQLLVSFDSLITSRSSAHASR